VRCIFPKVNDPGQPCHRCREHKIDCYFPTSKRRGRKRRSEFEDSQPELQRHDSIIDEDASIVHSPVAVGAIRDIAGADLQNPSDALHILAAATDVEVPNNLSGVSLWDYELVKRNVISVDNIMHLFVIFIERYHPFFPIIRIQHVDFNDSFALSHYMAQKEYLLTAILTIASQDQDHLHAQFWNYMQSLILKMMTDVQASVDAVAALLLLGEWVPRVHVKHSVGKGEEDRVAWMLVGNALRLGYYLDLDRAAREKDKYDEAPEKRVLWAYCYLQDRQISVRLGKAFWSRGPSLAAFDEAYQAEGALFRANIELTQLYGNVYEILYSSKARTRSIMADGEYVKYLDDFYNVVNEWKLKWHAVDIPETLKAGIFITFDFLRLYANAISFQASVIQSKSAFPKSVMINPDAKFIFESTEAAKSVVQRFLRVDAVNAARYMPVRFYLYTIYSIVYLHKAAAFNVFSSYTCKSLSSSAVEMFRAAAGSDQEHVGNRYARLLAVLQQKTQIEPREPVSFHSSPPSWQHDVNDNGFYQNVDFSSFLEEVPTALDPGSSLLLPFGDQSDFMNPALRDY